MRVSAALDRYAVPSANRVVVVNPQGILTEISSTSPWLVQCYPRRVIPVHQVMPGALQAVLRNAPLTQEKVAFAWRVTVGPAVDRATAIELRDCVLHVRAKDAAWRREVERSAGLIRTRLVTLLGDQAVRSIEVTTG